MHFKIPLFFFLYISITQISCDYELVGKIIKEANLNVHLVISGSSPEVRKILRMCHSNKIPVVIENILPDGQNQLSAKQIEGYMNTNCKLVNCPPIGKFPLEFKFLKQTKGFVTIMATEKPENNGFVEGILERLEGLNPTIAMINDPDLKSDMKRTVYYELSLTSMIFYIRGRNQLVTRSYVSGNYEDILPENASEADFSLDSIRRNWNRINNHFIGNKNNRFQLRSRIKVDLKNPSICNGRLPVEHDWGNTIEDVTEYCVLLTIALAQNLTNKKRINSLLTLGSFETMTDSIQTNTKKGLPLFHHGSSTQKLGLVIVAGSDNIGVSVVIKAWSWDIWACFLSSFFLIVAMVHFLGSSDSVIETMVWTISTLMNQEDEEQERRTFKKFWIAAPIIGVWGFACVLLGMAYTGALTSLLSSPPPVPTPDNLCDLLKSNIPIISLSAFRGIVGNWEEKELLILSEKLNEFDRNNASLRNICDITNSNINITQLMRNRIVTTVFLNGSSDDNDTTGLADIAYAMAFGEKVAIPFFNLSSGVFVDMTNKLPYAFMDRQSELALYSQISKLNDERHVKTEFRRTKIAVSSFWFGQRNFFYPIVSRRLAQLTEGGFISMWRKYEQTTEPLSKLTKGNLQRFVYSSKTSIKEENGIPDFKQLKWENMYFFLHLYMYGVLLSFVVFIFECIYDPLLDLVNSSRIKIRRAVGAYCLALRLINDQVIEYIE